MKKHLVLLVPLLFLMAQCKKDPPVHVNKFTCKVNGVFWEAVPKERSVLGNDLMAQKDPLGNTILVYAYNAQKKEDISIDINYSTTSQSSNISKVNPFLGTCGIQELDTSYNRKAVVLKHDTIARLIVGTFTFRVFRKTGTCMDTLNVTDGYFDMHYGF